MVFCLRYDTLKKKRGEGVTEKHRKLLWITALLIFLLFCILVGWLVGAPMVRLAGQPEKFRTWVDSFGVWSRLIFVGIVFLQVLVALIPGEPLELAAGYVFGVVEGSLLSMAGILLGSLVVFLLVQRLGPKFVEVFFPEREMKRLAFLKNPKKAKVLAFILMTIPGTPKDLISYFAGLTPLTVWQWLAIVAISRIPSLLTSTVSGGLAGTENYLLSVIVFVFTLCLSGIGVLYYRKICREQEKSADA